ncbi:MAG: hypothetical protein SPF89_05910 [Sphaerochaetaceae bacterium]|nr:hypothetical protein [Spirochaetales bacterium]MDY5499623.1 hypothetical protein [Sphaerochaetaceae bacterium]
MSQTVNGLGVRMEGSSIEAYARQKDVSGKIHMLLSAFSQIQALASVVPPTGARAKMFLSETEHFLATHSVGFRRNVKIVGHSGFTTTFDYSFTRGNGLAQVGTRIDVGTMRSMLFQFDDVRKNGSNQNFVG